MGPFNRYMTMDPQARPYWPSRSVEPVRQFMGFGQEPGIEMFIGGADKERCVAAVKETGEVIYVGKGGEQMAAKDEEISTWKWVAMAGIPGGLILGGLVGWFVGKRR